MILRELAAHLPGAKIIGSGDIGFDAIEYDSRRVRPGALFVAVPGFRVDGHDFARQAVADLFKHGQDPIEVIKWKDVYALLEDAIDAAEDAANVIERIVVKHA